MDDEICEHMKDLQDVTPGGNDCVECLKSGDTWFHVRFCEICGHLGCCEESKNKHATKHYHTTGHSMIKSFEPDEDWGYCYVEDIFYEILQVNVGSHHR